MKLSRRSLFLVFMLLVNMHLASGQNGSPDPSFGGGAGYVITGFGRSFNRGFSVALCDDGKLIVAGSTQNFGDDDFGADFAIAKYNEDGTPANEFGSKGKVMTDFGNQSSDVAMEVAVQDDGKIVVAGRSHAGNAFEDYHFAIARYNTDGTLDQSFGTQGKVLYPYETNGDYSYPVSMIIQPDGKIVVTGTCYGFPYDLFMTVRFSANGQVDPGFGVNGKVLTSLGEFCDGQPYAMKFQSDGKIVVGGLIHGGITFPTGVDFALVRYQPDGSPDPSFGVNGIVTTPVAEGDGYDWIEDLAILSDGKIIAVGNTDVLLPSGNNLCQVALVKYQSNGAIDNTFGNSGQLLADFGSPNPYVTSVAATSLNDFVVGGNVTDQNGDFDMLLAKFSAGGLPFPGFGVNGVTITHTNQVEGLMDVKFDENDRILAAGITGDEAHHDFIVLRYLDDITSGNDETPLEELVKIFPNPARDYLNINLKVNQDVTMVMMDMNGK